MRWPMSRHGADPTPTEAVGETSADPVSPAIEVDEIDDIGSSAAARQTGEPHNHERPPRPRRIGWSRMIAYALLPALALLIAPAAGYLKWEDATLREDQTVQPQTVQAAVDGTVALLSYRSETVDKDLEAAKRRLTGNFLDAYTSLTRDVVIPGAKQKQISATATVSAAALTSATASHAAVLLFVDQTVTVGKTAPTNAASSVRVTLDNIGGRWLISQFDPV
ncbi:MAG: Mce-associated rane protein [Mycobacterium sp.]|jgi:Mce-associated membrane protein|nr:Mce-associated rane protein [Mycobacterium sp.]